MTGAIAPSAYFLVGPTAVGKTAVAQRLAEERDAAILSADSMLIYRGMDIGTAKPSLEARSMVPYYGMDLVNPEMSFSVWDYRRHAMAALEAESDRDIIVVGGTGLYVKSLTDGLTARPGGDATLRRKWARRLEHEGIEVLQEALHAADAEALAALDDPRNPRRLIRALECAGLPGSTRAWGHSQGRTAPLVGLWMTPELLNARIVQRVDAMYDEGLLEEVERLLASGGTLSKTARQAIGYAEAAEFIAGHITQAEARERTVVRTRRLAKRQRTWFRHQAEVDWVEVTPTATVAALADAVAQRWRKHGATAITVG